MHKLYIIRDQFCDNRTLARVAIQWGYGVDYVSDSWIPSDFPGRLRPFGYVCEDQDRGFDQSMPVDFLKRYKIPGETCIPAGTYTLARTWSPKFERRMMEVKNVPAFQGIRVHAGKDETHTLGCLLVGLERRNYRYVTQSTAACAWLDARFDETEPRGETWQIVISREGAPLEPLDVRKHLPRWNT